MTANRQSTVFDSNSNKSNHKTALILLTKEITDVRGTPCTDTGKNVKQVCSMFNAK
jgi:hypothetical protein